MAASDEPDTVDGRQEPGPPDRPPPSRHLRARARDLLAVSSARAREAARDVAGAARHRPAGTDPAGTDGAAEKCVVFVSHSSRDRKAKDVVAELERLGYAVWVDHSNIKGADDWRVSIERAIRAADVFVLLLSPSVTRNPRYVWVELGLAQSAGKKIVPVRLHRTDTMPEGFNLVLSGLQRVDLFPDFATGMTRLADALGGADRKQPSGALTARLRRRTGQIRHFADEHELGRHLKVVAAAAASGAVLAAAALRSAMEEQQAQSQRLFDEQREAGEREQQQALEDYLDRTARLINDGMQEVKLSNGISPADYRDEFRPTFTSIIGEVRGNRPPRKDLQPRHDQLVDELRKLLAALDSAVEKADRGDVAGFQRAVERYNKAWSGLVISTLQWLESARHDLAAPGTSRLA
ncbi:toll/interleukin-1 receptor domain-containing protein [Geodermatophilus sp. URMC 63]